MSLPSGEFPEQKEKNIFVRAATLRVILMNLGFTVVAGVFVLHGVFANQVSSRSDTLSSPNISATSNHTIAFTAQWPSPH